MSQLSDDQSHSVEIVCPVVLRQSKDGLQFLSYSVANEEKHVVCAPLEEGSIPRDAASNTLLENSGLKPTIHPIDLGKSKGIEKGEAWHFFAFPFQGLPENWDHQSNLNSQTASFFWQDIETFIGDDDPPAFIRVIRFVQTKVERMDPTNRGRLFPEPASKLAETIMTIARTRGSGTSIDPTEIARHIAGPDEKQWRKLMKPIRAEVVQLTKSGKLLIMRKGKTVDPNDFKGLYRFILAS